MKNWLPYPLLWVLFTAVWLLLNQTVEAGHVLLGASLAFAACHVYRALQSPPRFARRPAVIARLAWLVLSDIVRSNVGVGRIVLNPRQRRQTSGFVDIPIELRHPGALAVLACIVTATPGTAWSRYDSARGVLTLHILDLIDESAWVDIIKGRYERRLKEIFE